MTYTTRIKDEIAHLDSNVVEAIAELSAFIRFDSDIKDNEIILTIENASVARRIYTIFKNIYDVNIGITVRRRYGFSNNLIYILTIKNKVYDILTDLSIWDKDNNYMDVPMEYIVSDEDVIRAYLRGVFITCGSINDPKTSRYHLEFIVDSKEYATFLCNMLNEKGLNSKIIKREKSYTVYIKESEKISDFLRIIKAYNGVLYYEDIRIYRDHKNMTNRLNNCEQANMDKVFMTASKQIKDIEKLKKLDMLDVLDEKLVLVINYRLKYPEASLQELAYIMSEELGHTITKSGLNHRFRKIRDIVSRLS